MLWAQWTLFWFAVVRAIVVVLYACAVPEKLEARRRHTASDKLWAFFFAVLGTWLLYSAGAFPWQPD